MALQRYTLDDPNPDPLNPIPQLSPAESELNEDAGDLSPEQQPTFLQSLWKNRDAIGQGLLYGANALVSYQNSVTQQENLEDRMRSTFQQKPIWDANYMYGDDQPIIKARDGAQIRTTLDTKAAPVEIEGGEFLILPDGNLEIASGPKHSKGGVDTVLPEGTKIFSNKLKPKGSKFTFAELAKKNDYTDHKKALENPFTSQVSKRGAELMLVRKQKALENLFEDQQDMNGNSSGEMMEDGGTPDFVRMQGPKKMKNFEERMYNPSQSLYQGDNQWGTHKMMSWESDGKFYAAPTIVERDGDLVELSEDEAIDYAFQTGELKEFKTDEEARAYAENGYKKGTPLENMAKGGWIKKATDSIKRRGTEGVCTGSKFGSSSCPPGSKRYNLAKTFKKMAKHEDGGEICYECGGKTIYEEGGTYDLPKSEIERLIKLGYEIEYED